jgi:DNA helicase HerA-like ATPase
MPMAFKVYDENKFICGMARQGKSTLLKVHLKQLPRGTTVVLWDPNGQHGDLEVSGGFKRYRGGEFEGKVRYVPRDGSPQEFDVIVAQAMRQGNVVVAVEEAQEVMSSSATQVVMRWLRTGQNRGVTYWAVTQIPAQCRDSVLSNAHYVYVFKLRRPDDTGYVAGWLAIPREEISSLKKFEYIATSQDGDPEHYKLRPVGILSQIKTKTNIDVSEKTVKGGELLEHK